MNQKSVRITSALTALSAIAAAVVAIVAVNSSGVLSAQSTTTTIDLLNVGMCVTTDKSIFKEKECDDGDGNESFNVGDRDEIVEREAVLATYALDPKSRDDVRAIIENSDLLKVSISDPGRDRRRTLLYPVAGFETILALDEEVSGEDVSVLQKIRTALGDAVEDEDALDKFNGQHADHLTDANDRQEGIKVRAFNPRDPSATTAVITQSGNTTLVFHRPMGTATDYPFSPLSVATDANNEYVDEVQWYGYIVNSGTTVDATYVGANVNKLINLGASGGSNLIADEDRTSGDTVNDIAPWMVVQANVQPGKEIHIVAVAYETSEREIITGGQKCDQATPEGNDEEGDCEPNSEQGAARPNFTSNEISRKGRELVAEVKGRGQKRNLSLKETSPFSGTYTGYIRITDANGDGKDEANDGTISGSRSNWGLELKHADAATGNDDPVPGDAAVVGVVNSLTIKYRDSDGDTKELRVAIDDSPPVIRVTSPKDDTSGDDRSPDFIGTVSDAGSGLAEDTFKLYVQNIENVAVPVISIPSGLTNSASSTLTTFGRYTGYTDTTPQFGVVSGNREDDSPVYFDEESSTNPQAHLTNNTADRKIVLADDYDDGDQMATFDDDARIEGTRDRGETIAGREIEINFQAVVIDLAGNVGFSDADKAKPSLIDDLDTMPDDRLGVDGNDPLPGVLGSFSAHVILLDDKDPEFHEDYPALTGFYGLDSDDEPVPHSRGIMIRFDNKVSEDTITENTFTVELDDESRATVDNFVVEDNLVFLRLTADLKTSETPKIGLASGHRIEDLAGNQLHAREVDDDVEAHDGIPPTLTVTLSGGSGTGEGKESSSGLTDETIEVTVSSDEKLSSANYTVLCSGFQYTVTGSTDTKGTADFIEDRSGSLVGGKPPTLPSNAKCSRTGPNKTFTESGLTVVDDRTNVWNRVWEDNADLPDGELTVVVYARDESVYKMNPEDPDEDDSENWAAVTAKFRYDTVLNPLVVRNQAPAADTVLPGPDAKVSEDRPFIILDFKGDRSTVSLQKLQVDGVDVTSRAETNDRNRFIYWPDSLDFGPHKVEVDAIDAAGNETTFRYEFEKTTRSAFVLRLYAGWNAISLPQQPIDGSLESVFSDPGIDQVIAYVRPNSAGPSQWQMATRQDGIWTSTYNGLTNIAAGPGYWVHAGSFVNQSVPLRSPERLSSNLPTAPIRTDVFEGWNFVGVIDQDGNQTQKDDFGKTLLNADNVPQTGRLYLGEYLRAYTWNTTLSRYNEVEKTTQVKIGHGIWVFYGERFAP